MDFNKSLFSSMGLFMDWKLQTVFVVFKTIAARHTGIS